MRYDSLARSVGDTPLVGLPRLSPSPTSGSGPSSRTTTRRLDQGPARPAMILEAERDGADARLHDPGADVGNTGISLAMVAKLRATGWSA